MQLLDDAPAQPGQLSHITLRNRQVLCRQAQQLKRVLQRGNTFNLI
jgi:hypothetical protein